MIYSRFDFVGGSVGDWLVRSIAPVRGDTIQNVARLAVVPAGAVGDGASWVLRGLVSNIRYATRTELTSLRAKQAALGRSEARHAALIPIRKSLAWWDLAQDERRAIFEEQSRHSAIGLEYLPAIARQLYHCRDLGEPFDFLTWLEYPPEHADGFEALVARLRSTPEWTFVEREVDIRLVRAA